VHSTNDAEQLLKAQALVLEENAKGSSLHDVLSILCVEAENLLCNQSRNSILLLKGTSLVHGAAPNLPLNYINSINGMRIGPNSGSCGTAAFLGKTVIVSDIMQDPLWVQYKDLAAQFHLAACWSTPILSSDKKVLGTFATYYDVCKRPDESDINLISRLCYLAGLIIEKANSEEAVREREEKLSEAEHIARIGNFTWLVESGEILLSSGMYRLLGYGPDEVFDSRRVTAEIYYPDDRERVTRWIKAGLSSGKERLPSIEYRLMCKDGSVLCVHAEGKMEYKDGEPFKLFGTCLDITERKQIEESLRESEAQFRSLAENSQDYIMRYDRQCRHLYQNAAAYRVSGLSEEEITGNTHRELGFEEDLCDLWERKITEVFKTKMPGSEVFEWDSPEGKIFLDWRVFPEFDKDGEVETVLAVSRDITENRKLEKQLVQPQKLEALGTLAGGVAHDFNNMLAIILGNADLLSAKLWGLESGGEHYLNEIKSAANRSADLAKQILSFSRMEITQLEPLDIGAVVEEAFHFLRATIPTNIEITIDVPAYRGKVMANRTQIHQVIVNLATNAFHSMEESGGSLVVTLREFASEDCALFECGTVDAQDCLLLSIEDSGYGIAKEHQEKIFDPFFTTKEVGKGTGLGLAVVYRIVQNHGGIIQLDSDLDQGTTANICFPLMDEALVVNQRVANAVEATGEARCIDGHILVVEDEISLAEMYEEFLQELGYVVTVCTDGSHALNLFRKNPNQFDLVLTDQAMPRMTGKQLSQEILKIRADTPIILSSGYSGVLSEESVSMLGVRKYLIKPIQLSALKRIIEECLA